MGVTAQLSAADSLAKLLRQTPPDTNRVNLLNDLAWEYKFENPSRARSLLDSAIQLARALRFPKGEATALNFRGVVEDIHGNSDQAIEYFQQALAIRQRLGDLSGVASLYNNLGNVMENRGDYLAALENYQQSLRLREQLRDTVRIMRAWYNMAILQESMGNYPEALDYIFRFLEYAEPSGDRHGMANAWNIIGNIKVQPPAVVEHHTSKHHCDVAHQRSGPRNGVADAKKRKEGQVTGPSAESYACIHERNHKKQQVKFPRSHSRGFRGRRWEDFSSQGHQRQSALMASGMRGSPSPRSTGV
ncbi:MAG: hypothetical protein KatS3mg029_0859 [Saprospiraceae bacterium]|nr:MAG: hypothetical protein KatS3mg029_0859 [Saprospiraceae bacterium]